MNRELSKRLAAVLLAEPEQFSADVLVGCDEDELRRVTPGFLGAAFKRALIEPTDHVIRSHCPQRRLGTLRTWRPTEAGILWARTVR
jgi:hypothetical protein